MFNLSMNALSMCIIRYLCSKYVPLFLQVTREQLHYARLKVGQDSVWELFAEDGEMRMYKREEEVDGMVCDPLKALHQVFIWFITFLLTIIRETFEQKIILSAKGHCSSYALCSVSRWRNQKWSFLQILPKESPLKSYLFQNAQKVDKYFGYFCWRMWPLKLPNLVTLFLWLLSRFIISLALFKAKYV